MGKVGRDIWEKWVGVGEKYKYLALSEVRLLHSEPGSCDVR